MYASTSPPTHTTNLSTYVCMYVIPHGRTHTEKGKQHSQLFHFLIQETVRDLLQCLFNFVYNTVNHIVLAGVELRRWWSEGVGRGWMRSSSESGVVHMYVHGEGGGGGWSVGEVLTTQ